MAFKIVGFLIEHDNEVTNQTLENSLVEETDNSQDLIDVIKYLNKGVLVCGWMGYFNDIITKKPVAPWGYDTDGIWIWPNYYPYYLMRHREYKIDEGFLEYLKQKDYQFSKKISKNVILEANDFLVKIGKWRVG